MIKNSFKSPHRPVRSVDTTAFAHVKTNKIWTRTDSIRASVQERKDKERKEEIRGIIESFRIEKPKKRVAVVKAAGKNWYHVIGYGKMENLTWVELKAFLKKEGYSEIKKGGLKFAI